jgi:phage/plasmid-associated DNA primase
MSDKSIDALIRLAKQSIPIQKTDDYFLSTPRRFFLAENLKPGKHGVPAIILYAKYHAWCKLNGLKPETLRAFSFELKKQFKSRTTKRGAIYNISNGSFDVSEGHRKTCVEKFHKGAKDGKTKEPVQT